MIQLVENKLDRAANIYYTSRVMSNGEAICQEFCDEVVVATKKLPQCPTEKELIRQEIKCSLQIKHFTGLVERMAQGGYCCTQVQRNSEAQSCTAWFEPQSHDRFDSF